MPWTLQWTRSGPAVTRVMVCASCGASFGCELSAAGCWCRKVDLTDEARARLRESYTDCLCPACLERAK